MNSALPSADLSSSFGKSKRAEGIAPPPARPPRGTGRKAPTGPTDQTDAQTDAQTKEHTHDQAALGASQDARVSTEHTPPAPRRRGRPPTPAANTSINGARLVLWTPISIRTRMQAVRNQQGTLYLDQVLDALECTVDDLPDLVQKATSPSVVQGRLFERTSSAVQSDGQRVQLTINGFLKSHIEIIDNLVGSTGAPSRSALINAALDSTLPEF